LNSLSFALFPRRIVADKQRCPLGIHFLRPENRVPEMNASAITGPNAMCSRKLLPMRIEIMANTPERNTMLIKNVLTTSVEVIKRERITISLISPIPTDECKRKFRIAVEMTATRALSNPSRNWC
jgi:hypothetical protein